MERIKWFDWANVLAMLCVVWFHIPSVLEMPVRYTEYIAVNVSFFLLAGYSFTLAGTERRAFGALLRHQGLRLVRPTLVFYCIFYLLWLVVGKRLAGDAAEWYAPVIELLTGNFSLVLATYWFVVCLMGLQILYYMLYRLIKPPHVLAFICGLLPAATLLVGDISYFRLTNVLLFLPFFALGSLSSTTVSPSVRWRNSICVVLGLLLYFVLTRLFAITPLYSPTDALWGVGLCGVVCALSRGLVGWSSGERWMHTLRYGALILLATQNYIIGVTKVLLDKITQEPDFLAHHFALKPVVLLLVYLLTLPVIHLVRHHCPQILGRSGAAKR